MVNAVAYFMFLYFTAYEFARYGWAGDSAMPPVVTTADPLWPVIVGNTVLMLWRFFQRSQAVAKIYGWPQGLLSILRYPLGNLINSYATIRGIWQFFGAMHAKRTIRWDKTSHVFPSHELARPIPQPILIPGASTARGEFPGRPQPATAGKDLRAAS